MSSSLRICIPSYSCCVQTAASLFYTAPLSRRNWRKAPCAKSRSAIFPFRMISLFCGTRAACFPVNTVPSAARSNPSGLPDPTPSEVRWKTEQPPLRGPSFPHFPKERQNPHTKSNSIPCFSCFLRYNEVSRYNSRFVLGRYFIFCGPFSGKKEYPL